MDDYRQLADTLKQIGGKQITIAQGIVKSVDGNTCSVQIGGVLVSGVRLRASESKNDKEILLVPKKGTAVVVGSLSGDFAQLAVLSIEEVESITIHGTITINDGKLGGLINIEDLTSKLNEMVDTFNKHTHVVNTTGSATAQSGTAKATTGTMSKFNKSDYEDDKVKH